MQPGDLTQKQWAKLKPLLPPQKPRTGRPNFFHRKVLNGILWILRTGAPWRDLPKRYGKHSSVASRFYRWQKIGLWTRLFETLRQQAHEDGDLDWGLNFLDGSIVRAHQHAAGAQKK